MDDVLFELKDGVATVTLNRPDARNAVNPSLAAQFEAAIDRIESDSAIRCAVLTGAGPVFCAGMDLKAFLDGQADGIMGGRNGFAGFVKRRRTKPIIAAVEGAALAGGFEIMLSCEMAVAGRSAVFGLPEPKIGLVAAAGGAMRISRRIPRVLANELVLTADPIPAARAMEHGLINQVCDDGEALETAREIARKIAVLAPGSITLSMQLLQTAHEAGEGEGWIANDRTMIDVVASADAREGVSAFLEKRAPRWSDG